MLRFRVLLALMIALAVTVLAPISDASAATYHFDVPPDGHTYTPQDGVNHNCAVFGSDGTTEAVHCADFYGSSSPYGQLEVWAHNSVFCQRVAAPNTVVECAGIHEAVRICAPGGAGCLTSAGVCGATFGHSPCGALKVMNASPHAQINDGCGGEVWGVSGDAEDGAADSVVLPGSNLSVTAPNIATDHYKPGVTVAHCQ